MNPYNNLIARDTFNEQQLERIHFVASAVGQMQNGQANEKFL